MKINITAGECLNQILQNKYTDELFIPFNEAMIEGDYQSELFSENFMIERAKVHHVDIAVYKDKLKDFLKLLHDINEYQQICLYFGDETFCQINRKIVIETLKHYNFRGQIISYVVDENNGNIISKTILPLTKID